MMKSVFAILILLSLIWACSDSKPTATEVAETAKMENSSEKTDKAKTKRLQFSVDIEAKKARIWDALWDDKNYRVWAGIFYEGSYFESDSLKEGSRILFLAPDESGIYSVIEKHIPNEYIQFRHIGNVVGGKALPVDEEARKWTGTTETYSLSENANFVTLSLEIDVLEEHVAFMSEKIPEALEQIKKISSSEEQ